MYFRSIAEPVRKDNSFAHETHTHLLSLRLQRLHVVGHSFQLLLQLRALTEVGGRENFRQAQNSIIESTSTLILYVVCNYNAHREEVQVVLPLIKLSTLLCTLQLTLNNHQLTGHLCTITRKNSVRVLMLKSLPMNYL